MLRSSGTTLLMPRNTPHMATGLVALSSSTAALAWSRRFRQDADGTMQCFVWHKDQKAVCHCLAAILNVADDSNIDASS